MKNRLRFLILIAIALLALVIAKYYPIIKMLMKKQMTISEFTITKPEGFEIISDSTMLSYNEPFSFHFAQLKNGREFLGRYKSYMEKKGIVSSYDSIEVGCKTGIKLTTIKSGDNPSEDIKIFVEPDLSILVSMPFDKESKRRELFLKNFLQKNVSCVQNNK